MPITCPKCRTSYQVSDEQIGEKGRRVKCIKCEHVWHALVDPIVEFADMETASSETKGQGAKNAAPEKAQPPAQETAAQRSYEAAKPTSSSATPPMQTSMPGEYDQLDGDDADQSDGIVEVGNAQLSSTEANSDIANAVSTDPLETALSDESADIIANVSQAMIEIENQEAAPNGGNRGVNNPTIVRTEIKVKKPTHTKENLAGIVAVAFALCLLVSAVMFREPIVRTVPETARLYGMLGMPVNLRGLEFANVTTSTDFENGVPVLMVSGTIINVSAEAVGLPVVRLALRTTRGQEVYAWSYEPSVKRLAAGEQVDFNTRVASPPDGASDIQLRFIGIDRLASGG
ncbi:MAG: MJ0042-type zinc finger domain-containing protein [Pseudomonadota bacterium]